MQISEFFVSIQGEGPDTGLPCIFIRTCGCNLACDWCDTGYAREGGREMRVTDVVAMCVGFKNNGGPNLVCLTGGEPMLQHDAPELMALLVSAGFRVTLMTNGSIGLDGVPSQVRVLVDLKVFRIAGSDGQYPHPDILSGARDCCQDTVKFVIPDRGAFDIAVAWCHGHNLFGRFGAVVASPAWGMIEPADLADWILEAEPRLRLGLQLHKYIWGPDTRK